MEEAGGVEEAGEKQRERKGGHERGNEANESSLRRPERFELGDSNPPFLRAVLPSGFRLLLIFKLKNLLASKKFVLGSR